MSKVYDYIVIGSGFGGSVSAMRLAEKGYDVLVIEKGKEIDVKNFPKTNWDFKRFYWAPLFKWFGILKLTLFKDVFVISGVGVGGGSLGYANTHMYPSDLFFENPIWANQVPGKFNGKGWKEVLEPFYQKARFMLGSVKNKIFNRDDEILKEVAKDMGMEASFGGVNVGVYFGDQEKEVDPYFKGLGPLRKGCTECAGCMIGCRENAKNTLDKNYLFFAKKFGALIKAECQVDKIEYTEKIYNLKTRSSTSWFNKNVQTFKSKNLVVSGGVLGTMDLLLKQKHDHKTLNRLSDCLGENLRTNSESLCGVTSGGEKLNHGIAITSVFNPDEHTHIEAAKYPNGSNSMKFFATLATGPGPAPVRAIKLIFNILTSPFKFVKLMINRKWAENSVILVVMQSLDNSMKMVYRSFPFKGMSIKNQKDNKVPAYIEVGQNVMHRYAKKVNGTPQNALTEVLFNMSSTAHILGGCPMGKTLETGVINNKFEVHGYPGMYILDGSIMPCNLGVNPSLTITALSEYAMSWIPEKPENKNVSLDEQLKALA
ncbi:MAG TPA: GMC family oxidoreductase [Flavobacteriales bacterium]|nr:GMC family oxidoreductase [Flavobacteriales bacterium]